MPSIDPTNPHLLQMAAERKKLILVVEDDALIAQLIEELVCDELSCDVIVAADGKQALHLARSQSIDLIILDYLIPELNGLQVFDTLQANMSTRSIPVLFVTAAAQSEVDFDGRGMNNYIRKPFDLDDFTSRVRALLYAGQSPPEPEQSAPRQDSELA